LLEAFTAPGTWLKGNLHTHTTNSDGRVTPQERIAGYSSRGYDFIAFTDHYAVTRETDGELIVIPGAEYDFGEQGRFYHLVMLNAPQGFHLFDGMSVQEAIDEIAAMGAMSVLAHPYWCGLSLPDLRDIRGCLGIEVYNHNCHCGIAKGLSTVHWDDLLAAGWRGYGFAVDDCHYLSDAYGGWIMLKSEKRDLESILDAIKGGRFYSTCGPEIRSIERRDNQLSVECSDAVAVNLVCRKQFGWRVAAPEGQVINSAQLTLDRQMGYVRVEVVDARGRAAWSNPLFLT